MRARDADRLVLQELLDVGAARSGLRDGRCTLRQQGAKIMEQYKASGVDFTVVVKDNQVVIKAKPKT